MHESIEVRLAVLERSNRRKNVLLIALAIVAMMGFTGEPVRDIVRARKVELVASDGKTAGVLEATQYGGWLTLNGPQGGVAARLAAASGNEGLLTLHDDKGRVAVSARAFDHGGTVSVYAPQSRGADAIWSTPSILDQHGK